MRDFAEKIRDRRDPNWRVRRFDRRWRIVSRAVLLAMFLLLVACENPVAIEGSERFTPDPNWGWRATYAELSECAGVSGDYDDLAWFKARSVAGPEDKGVWKPPARIYLEVTGAAAKRGVHGVEVPFGWKTVQHEMVHDLLGGGSHDHPAFDGCAHERTDAIYSSS